MGRGRSPGKSSATLKFSISSSCLWCVFLIIWDLDRLSRFGKQTPDAMQRTRQFLTLRVTHKDHDAIQRESNCAGRHHKGVQIAIPACGMHVRRVAGAEGQAHATPLTPVLICQ